MQRVTFLTDKTDRSTHHSLYSYTATLTMCTWPIAPAADGKMPNPGCVEYSMRLGPLEHLRIEMRVEEQYTIDKAIHAPPGW
jgi:hypothetical protein